MKLENWLLKSKVQRQAFAKIIGVSPSYITLLCGGPPAWPGYKVALKIYGATDGKVTPTDFLPERVTGRN